MSQAVVLATPERLIAASDSWSWHRDGGGRRDECVVRKVDAQGPYVCVMTGSALLLAAWERTASIAGEAARERAQRVLSCLQELLKQPHAYTGADFEFSFAVYRWVDGGRAGWLAAPIEAYQFEGLVRAGRTDLETVKDEHSDGWTQFVVASFFGWTDHDRLNELKEQRIQHALAFLLTQPTEAAMAAHASDMIATVAKADRSRKVGGLTHICVLDKSGSRWLTAFSAEMSSNTVWCTPAAALAIVLGSWTRRAFLAQLAGAALAPGAAGSVLGE